MQQEGVEVRVAQVMGPLLGGGEADGLDGLDAEGLEDRVEGHDGYRDIEFGRKSPQYKPPGT